MKKIIFAILTILLVGYLTFQSYIFSELREQRTLINEENFEQVLSGTGHEILVKNPSYLHNIWNTYYEIFDPQERDIETLEASLSYFSGSLALGENVDTRYNYDLVKKLLEEVSSSQEDQGEEESEEQESEQQQDDEQQKSNTSEESKEQQELQEPEDQDLQINKRDEEYTLGEEDSIWELTPQEQRELEQKIEELKQEQVQNQQYFNKQPQESGFDNLFDVFFQEEINRGGKKDW